MTRSFNKLILLTLISIVLIGCAATQISSQINKSKIANYNNIQSLFLYSQDGTGLFSNYLKDQLREDITQDNKGFEFLIVDLNGEKTDPNQLRSIGSIVSGLNFKSKGDLLLVFNSVKTYGYEGYNPNYIILPGETTPRIMIPSVTYEVLALDLESNIIVWKASFHVNRFNKTSKAKKVGQIIFDRLKSDGIL